VQPPPITPAQAAALAKAMLDSCEGATFCAIGKIAAPTAMCDSLPVDAAQAANVYLTQLTG
jgi:hypothetical protein